MCNLENIYQKKKKERKKETDSENKLMATRGEG